MSHHLTLATLCDWDQAATKPHFFTNTMNDIAKYRRAVSVNSRYEMCELACVICAKIISFTKVIAVLPVDKHDAYMRVMFPIDVLANAKPTESIFDLSNVELVAIGRSYFGVYNLVMGSGVELHSAVATLN